MKLIYFLAAVSVGLSLILLLPAFPEEIPQRKARLQIIIDNREISIPAGIGIPGGNLRAYKGNGIIYISKAAPLGEFFNEWGVVFTNKCLFQYCNEEMRMFVNGVESLEFDSYILKPGDEVLLYLNTI